MESSDSISPESSSDAWGGLRQWTTARVAIGRAGGSLRTETLLDFRLAHARARDAVHASFSVEAIRSELAAAGMESMVLHSRVNDQRTYLLRPDLGRELAPASVRSLGECAAREEAPWDIALILSDGLSATAAARQAVPTLIPLHRYLVALGRKVAPILVVPYARVKLQDAIGAILGVRHTVMLLGERPGLGSPDSLGAYFTCNPGLACTDADRNCVSNIRPAGLAPERAAMKLAELLTASDRLGLSGVGLKDHGHPSLDELLPGTKA